MGGWCFIFRRFRVCVLAFERGGEGTYVKIEGWGIFMGML